jgi:hypothetical protein
MLSWATGGQHGSTSRKKRQVPAAPYGPGYQAPSGSNSYAPAVSMVPSGFGSSSQRAVSTGMTAAQKQQQLSLQNAAELKQMLDTLEKVDDERRRISLLDTLCAVGDALNLPVHPNPPGIANGNLVVDLMKHQVRMSSFLLETDIVTSYLESSLTMVHRPRVSYAAKKRDRQARPILAIEKEWRQGVFDCLDLCSDSKSQLDRHIITTVGISNGFYDIIQIYLSQLQLRRRKRLHLF